MTAISETSAPTTHQGILAWVNEIAELTQPDSIHWCTGDAAEWEQLTNALVESGTLGRYQAPLYSALASPSEDGTRYLQGAAVMLDTKNGDVLAWVGGRNYAHSQFDRVSQARRQPGSGPGGPLLHRRPIMSCRTGR